MNDKLCDSNGIQTIPLPDNSQGGKKMGGEMYQVEKRWEVNCLGGKIYWRGIIRDG